MEVFRLKIYLIVNIFRTVENLNWNTVYYIHLELQYTGMEGGGLPKKA